MVKYKWAGSQAAVTGDAVVTVPMGSRLVLRTADGRHAELRVLSTVAVADLAVLPVMVLSTAFGLEGGVLELPTDRGVLQVAARLLNDEGWLEVRLPVATEPVQRRGDVRRRLQLPLEGTATAGPVAAGVRGLPPSVVFSGQTIDISAGGMRAHLDELGSMKNLREFYVELDTTSARPIRAVVEVVALRSGLLHGKFVVITTSDREYLVRRIFEAERADARLRSAERAAADRGGTDLAGADRGTGRRAGDGGHGGSGAGRGGILIAGDRSAGAGGADGGIDAGVGQHRVVRPARRLTNWRFPGTR